MGLEGRILHLARCAGPVRGRWLMRDEHNAPGAQVLCESGNELAPYFEASIAAQDSAEQIFIPVVVNYPLAGAPTVYTGNVLAPPRHPELFYVGQVVPALRKAWLQWASDDAGHRVLGGMIVKSAFTAQTEFYMKVGKKHAGLLPAKKLSALGRIRAIPEPSSGHRPELTVWHRLYKDSEAYQENMAHQEALLCGNTPYWWNIEPATIASLAQAYRVKAQG